MDVHWKILFLLVNIYSVHVSAKHDTDETKDIKEFHGPYWDGLKVRFGNFTRSPRTEQGAIDEGFTMISDCDLNSPFRGKRYMKDNETNIILLYDVNGYISGIQVGISKDLPGYPSPEIQPPFISHGDLQTLTAYFVNPATICIRGRSEQVFKVQGTGTGIYIQNGTNPETDLIEMALEEPTSSGPWVKGKCFPKMGYHYFYNLEVNMRCDTFLPVALLYYEGELKGFVWSFGVVLNTTRVPYEHPEPEFFNELMFEIPHCLKTLRRSTLHVYLEDDPESYSCEPSSGQTINPMLFSTILTLFIGAIMSFVTI